MKIRFELHRVGSQGQPIASCIFDSGTQDMSDGVIEIGTGDPPPRFPMPGVEPSAIIWSTNHSMTRRIRRTIGPNSLPDGDFLLMVDDWLWEDEYGIEVENGPDVNHNRMARFKWVPLSPRNPGKIHLHKLGYYITYEPMA